MNFIEAIKKLQEGYKLTRKLGWLDEHGSPEFIYYDNHTEYYGYLDEKKNEYSFYHEDFLADDWEVTGGDKFISTKLHTFEEALASYKRGSTIVRNTDRPEQKRNINDGLPCLFSRSDILADDWEILP